MRKNRKAYNVVQKISTIFMMVALLWLTISLPFVFVGQQEISKQNQTNHISTPLTANEEESSNPFGNSTEEKASGNSSVSEEYLHTQDKEDGFLVKAKQYGFLKNASTYIAYHGELLVPPPNLA